MPIPSLARVQGFGGQQWKLHANGSLLQTHHSVGWVNDGVTAPNAITDLGFSLGPPDQALGPLVKDNSASGLACGNLRLLRICAALEAPGLVPDVGPLSLNFSLRPPGGVGVITDITTVTLTPNAPGASVEESEFTNQLLLEQPNLLTLNVAGLSLLGPSQDFTYWQTCLWLLTP